MFHSDFLAITENGAAQAWADRAVQTALRDGRRITSANIDALLDGAATPDILQRSPDALAALRQQARGAVWWHPRLVSQG